MSMGKKTRGDGQKVNMNMNASMRLFRRRFFQLRRDAEKLYEDYGQHTAITMVAPDGSKHAIGFPSVETVLSLSKEQDQHDSIALLFSPGKEVDISNIPSDQSLKQVQEKLEADVLDMKNEPSCSSSTSTAHQ